MILNEKVNGGVVSGVSGDTSYLSRGAFTQLEQQSQSNANASTTATTTATTTTTTVANTQGRSSAVKMERSHTGGEQPAQRAGHLHSDRAQPLIGSPYDAPAHGFSDAEVARAETEALSELHARLSRIAARQPQLLAAAVSLLARADATLLTSVHRAVDRVALLACSQDVARAAQLLGGVVPFRSRAQPPLAKLRVQRDWSREWRLLSDSLQRSRRQRRAIALQTTPYRAMSSNARHHMSSSYDSMAVSYTHLTLPTIYSV